MDTRTEEAKRVITTINKKCSKHYQISVYKEEVIKAIALDPSNLATLEAYVVEQIGKGCNLYEALQNYITAYEEGQITEKATEKSEKKNPSSFSFSGMGAMMETAMNSAVEEFKNSTVAKFQEEIEHIKKQLASMPQHNTTQKLEVKIIDKVTTQEGPVHSQFQKVLNYVANHFIPLLVGPAGSGKSVLCEQVAHALGIPFYFSNAVTQEYKVQGFTDAMGIYHQTQFFEAFKNGGVFLLDEVDASCPEALITLNAALSSGYYDFPEGKTTEGEKVGGFTRQHKDFYFICAGNTFGTGATSRYIGRNQLDRATLDRFVTIPIDYDRAIEEAITGNNQELVQFAHDIRHAAEEQGLEFLLTYRGLKTIATMEQLEPLEDVLKEVVYRELGKDDIRMLLDGLEDRKYVQASRRLI